MSEFSVPHTPFSAMQAAVDVVHDSDHGANKIAATLFGGTSDDAAVSLSRTNHWPERILERIGSGHRIGNASGTVHAEMACLLDAMQNALPTQGASIAVTDPFCPNCAKMMAAAGIREIYIDHKGFGKDWFARRRIHFEDISLKIAEKAGIAVYEIHRKAEKITPFVTVSPEFERQEELPSLIKDLPDFRDFIRQQSCDVFSAAIVRDHDGDSVALSIPRGPVPGMSGPDDLGDIGQKYTLILEPVDHLLMICARFGLKPEVIYSSRVPTAREQVHLVATGMREIFVGHLTEARDSSALEALAMLESKDVLAFKELK